MPNGILVGLWDSLLSSGGTSGEWDAAALSLPHSNVPRRAREALGTIAGFRTSFPEVVEGSTPRPIEEDWQNTLGLPSVKEVSGANEYYSPDMADSAAGSRFKPVLGCKCGAFAPALTHPELDFKPGFLGDHPDFLNRLRTIHVHMEDVTPGSKQVHWDASYDLFRWHEKGGTMRLAETTPHMSRSGSQLRFMTFCPPKGGGPHRYELRVTAFDHEDAPIEYFQDKVSIFEGRPPEAPEVTPSETSAVAETSREGDVPVAVSTGVAVGGDQGTAGDALAVGPSSEAVAS